MGIAALLALGHVSLRADEVQYQIHGGGWADFGRIMHASDSLIALGGSVDVIDLSGNSIQSFGAQFTAVAEFGENWEGAFGFGTQKVSHSLGTGKYAFTAISLFQNFITQSRLTYFMGEKEASPLSVTVGNFPYKYDANVHNLGLYLLRGPVYPGFLMGGFQDFAVDDSKSTMLGANIRQSLGNFSHDLLLNNERDIPPTFDWSLAYVAKYRALGALEIGGGVNFYRLIPYNSDLQTPGHFRDDELGFRKDKYVEEGDTTFTATDTTIDTVFFTHQGTKVMAMFSIDFNTLFQLGEKLGPEDLKLYGEAAIIGLQDYGTLYGDISKRIPFMIGFNLPVFGLLDRVSLELEWYGSRFRNDLANVGNNNVVADWTLQDHPIPSPTPVTYADFSIEDSTGIWINPMGDTVYVFGTGMDKGNMTTDDWKWSLLIEKSFHKHIRFTAQFANDHFRPRPIATGLITSTGGTAEALSATNDWYFMIRMGYFF